MQSRFPFPFPSTTSGLSTSVRGRILFGKLGISSHLQRSTTLTVSAAGRHLVCGTHEDECVGLGIILECFPHGTWEGFRVPHRDYVVVRLTTVFPKYSHHASYCEIPDLRTLGDFVGYWIL
jgi:hypothetical protein